MSSGTRRNETWVERFTVHGSRLNLYPACPAVPCSIPKDSAAYLDRVAPEDGAGVKFFPVELKDRSTGA